MIEAHPLYWPEGRPRTVHWQREDSRLDTTFARARDNLIREIKLLVGGRWAGDPNIVISTNIPLRNDGLPYANYKKPDDTGVAVYFTYKKQQVCFACDRWIKIEDNMQAICKTIEALCGIARWGTGDMMEAAFRGFTSLPSPGNLSVKGWREVLGFPPGSTPNSSEVNTAYKRLRSEAHPDRISGSSEKFHSVQIAFEQALSEVQQC